MRSARNCLEIFHSLIYCAVSILPNSVRVYSQNVKNLPFQGLSCDLIGPFWSLVYMVAHEMRHNDTEQYEREVLVRLKYLERKFLTIYALAKHMN